MNEMGAEGILYGERLGQRCSRSKTFPDRRVCAAPGCVTVLSMYNSRSLCATHDWYDYTKDKNAPRAHRSGRRPLAVQGARPGGADSQERRTPVRVRERRNVRAGSSVRRAKPMHARSA